MKNEEKKLKNNDTAGTSWADVVAIFIVVACIVLILGICLKTINQRDAYRVQMLKNEIEWTREYTEIETAAEFLQKDYYRLTELYERLYNRYEEMLVSYSNALVVDKEQVLEDMESYVSIIIRYYESGYRERNPEVTLEQYIKLANLELYNRLLEY